MADKELESHPIRHGLVEDKMAKTAEKRAKLRTRKRRQIYRYNEKTLSKVRDLVAQNLTKQQIADKLGVDIRTIYWWKQHRPEFAAVINEARAAKLGSPDTYRPEYCGLVLEAAKQGATPTEMALECGAINRSTLDKWGESYPEFKEALSRSYAISQAWWESQGRTAIFGGLGGYFSATGYSFMMRNMFQESYQDARKLNLETSLVDAIQEIEGEVVEPKLIEHDADE